MMINCRENINLKKYSTFSIGGECKYLIEINCVSEVIPVFDFIKTKISSGEIEGFYILGEGSNTIFSNNVRKLLIVKNNIKIKYREEERGDGIKVSQDVKYEGISIEEDRGDNVLIRAYAGVSFDVLVEYVCERDLYGIENLSYIPGSVGAAPVQNIGAYGVEIKDTIKSLYVYNIEKEIFETIENEIGNKEMFVYRDSFLKRNKNKYLVLYIDFVLNKKRQKEVVYEGLEICDSDNANSIRNKVIQMRKSKLYDYLTTPNCGSFFKNILINESDLERVLKIDPTLKVFKTDSGYKLSSGQIINNLGLKGLSVGGVSVGEKHALVLVNKNSQGTYDELCLLINKIKIKVKEKYGLILEEEVNMI